MQISPYLNFNGNCAEAIRFYQEVLGGTIEMMQTHGESPIADQVPPEWHDAVLHARYVVNGTVIMASDRPPPMHDAARGMHVAITVESVRDAERIFNAFAEGGTITMPFAESFFAARFGMVTDRFGTPWMVSSGPA